MEIGALDMSGLSMKARLSAFDWDSLCREREPALVGAAAHGFCADWSQTAIPQAPTMDEARAFVSDYEQARGKPFSVDAARCGYAAGGDHHETPGSFLHLLWSERTHLFEL
jgi:hypothetical protein